MEQAARRVCRDQLQSSSRQSRGADLRPLVESRAVPAVPLAGCLQRLFHQVLFDMHLGEDLVWDLAELPAGGVPDQAERAVDGERPLEARGRDFGCGPAQVLGCNLAVRLAVPDKTNRLVSLVLPDDVLVAGESRITGASAGLISLANEARQRVAPQSDD